MMDDALFRVTFEPESKGLYALTLDKGTTVIEGDECCGIWEETEWETLDSRTASNPYEALAWAKGKLEPLGYRDFSDPKWGPTYMHLNAKHKLAGFPEEISKTKLLTALKKLGVEPEGDTAVTFNLSGTPAATIARGMGTRNGVVVNIPIK